jgi:adenylate kinase family enzyme
MEADKPEEKDLEKTVKKELVLMRGLPGSGKSTKARKIAGEVGVIYSTDDFFMIDGKYIYNPKLIGDYH